MSANFIPYGRQEITQEDIALVTEVLQADFLTQGPAIKRFEQAVANYCSATHAVAVCNATAALHLACKALGVGPNDWVWTSPNTFLASANCALYCGANIDFVDIDSNTYNLCAEQLAQKLIQAEREGKLPKVVIPVHFSGQSCDMQAIKKLADKYDFKIIEDASHAIGASYLAEKVGSCQYSDITVFSFHPVKIITTGEGGMLLTNDSYLAEKIRLLASHGMTRDPNLMMDKAEGPWYYQQIDLGYNYRITDIQCALGYSQLQRLNQYVSKRHEIAEIYNTALADLSITLPFQASYAYSAYHLYVICVEEHNRLEIFKILRDAGIGVNVHYIPVYLQPYYKRLGFARGYCPIAESYYARAISLPMYATLTSAHSNFIVKTLYETIK
jgi:UDP-4-amino-4,6-dideoxy-N-acetyl-beta-L-altrosamine transaminase